MKLKNRKYRNHEHVICDQCGYKIKDPDFSGRSPTRRQLRCTINNGRPGQRTIGSYSECQASFHQKRLQKKNKNKREIEDPRPEVKCEICRKEIKRPAYNQKACVHTDKNIKTPCQQESHRRQMREAKVRRYQAKKKMVNSEKPCLKCGKGFRSVGKHDRICEDCERTNSNVSYRVYKDSNNSELNRLI